MNSIKKRFIKYVQFDTQSDEYSNSTPSTSKQTDFARFLFNEMSEMGLFDINLDDNGYLMAGLPSNSIKNHPVIGLIAHMDTSPDYSAENVNPKIHKNYDGRDIILDPDEPCILSPADFPELKNYTGNTLITTDGKSLLGADDKAGIAIIMDVLQYFLDKPEIKHGGIRVAFTPDEEIGRGADHFNVRKFGADFAYTLDGGEIGELEYENFNAALAEIKIKGRNVHPGTAKNKMINANLLASEFIQSMPGNEKPECTDGYEGFFHLIDMQGNVEDSTLRFLIRDHSSSAFRKKKDYIRKISEDLRKKYHGAGIEVIIKDQYFNMKEKIEPVIHIVDRAKEAIINAGINPIIKPIRGGTDGSRLSFMGLPCPNLFTGGHNYHGRFEYIPLESMLKAVEVVIGILQVDE